MPLVAQISASFQAPNKHFLDFVLSHARFSTNRCTCQRFDTPYRLAMRTVPDHNLIFMRQGRVTWIVEEVPYDLGPGDLILVGPGIKHNGFSTTPSMTLGSIHVNATLPGGQNVFDVLIPPPLRHVRAGTRLDAYLREVIAEFDRADDADAQLTMLSWARLVVLELIRYDAEAGTLRQRPVDPLVAAVLDELNQRLAEPTSLDWLAQRSGFTPQHVNRVFRRVLGVTPLQYLSRMRMDRAAALLADGQLTIRAVGQQVGFEDPYYFSRMFKQYFGQSPNQYREALEA